MNSDTNSAHIRSAASRAPSLRTHPLLCSQYNPLGYETQYVYAVALKLSLVVQQSEFSSSKKSHACIMVQCMVSCSWITMSMTTVVQTTSEAWDQHEAKKRYFVDISGVSSVHRHTSSVVYSRVERSAHCKLAAKQEQSALLRFCVQACIILV